MAECSETSSVAMWAAMKAYKTAVSTGDRMVEMSVERMVASMDEQMADL